MATRPGTQLSKLSWWRRGLTVMALKMAQAATQQTLSLTDSTGWGRLRLGERSVTGKVVDDEGALRSTVVWACVKILAESVGMLPRHVFEEKPNGNVVRVKDHPLEVILSRQPNQDMDGQEFLEAGQVNLGLRGNGYHFKDTSASGEVTSLYPIPARDVIPQRNKETREISYKVNVDGKWETYPRERIWHVKGFGGDGLVGLSPIGAAREAMGLALASEEFQARFFGQGARPSAVAKIPTWLDPEQRKIARENLNQLLGGLDNAHRVHLLEGGMDLDPWGLPLDDLQFVELRRFQLSEICRLYRVPPHMVADMERATFSNIEHMSLEFVMFTLMPWLVRWEKSAERWLLKPSERGKLIVRFNAEGLLRADSAGRAAFYTQALQNGWMSRNEVRAKENLNNVDGLDEYTVQSNMALVEQIATLVQQRSQAAASSQPKHATVVVNQPAPVSLTLPETVKQNITQDIPSLARLADGVSRLAKGVLDATEGNNDRMEGLVDAVGALAGHVRANNDEVRSLAAVVSKPRRAVYDENGQPIGTEVVDTLNP